MEIKIRYTWKRASDGNIIQRIVLLRELELSGLYIFDIPNYTLISKDLFTGLQDAKGVDMYENDNFKWNGHKGVIKFKGGCFVFEPIIPKLSMTCRDHRPEEFEIINKP